MYYSGSVYKNDEGKVLGIVIVARDVTKQKQAALYTRSIQRQVWTLLLLSMRKGKSLTEIMH
jgi:signal transduction histidine kinase